MLQRLTNSVFPSTAPDRRRELARVWQEWNYLTNLKRNGFAHVRPGERPGKGDFALLCPACPHPDINLPPSWRKDPKQWLYRRYIVADGNFVLDHLANRKGNTGVLLTRGASYMAEPIRLAKHLKASGKEGHERAPIRHGPVDAHDSTADSRRTSNVGIQGPATSYLQNLRAVSNKNVFKKGYDVTGVVAVACARHGCFCPGSVVDLQKGERQKNVDYAVIEALRNTNAFKLPGGLLAYDVNCQYCVKFRQRIEAARYLKCDPNYPIDFVIGLFHVHGHKDECLSRYAPTFLPGAGVTSGEILESLWHTTNGAALITRNMLLGGRWELLDACMQASNEKKSQDLPGFLERQLALAREQLQEASADFERLNKSATKRLRRRWKQQMADANAHRRSDPHAMDVYNISATPAVPKKVVQVQLMDEEKEKKGRLGVVKWISEAIEAQKAQIDLRSLIFASRDPSVSVSVDIATKSQALTKRLDKLYDIAADLFSDIDLDHEGNQWENDCVEVCVCEEECSCEELAELPWFREPVDVSSHSELLPLPLPSSFEELPPGWKVFAKQEEKLRVAQAEEALESLRGAIAEKSYLYRGNKSFATGKRGRTRQYQDINEIESRMRLQIKYYESALWALMRLGVYKKYGRFQRITRADTKAVTAIFDPNRRGERNASLSWLWHIDLGGAKVSDGDYLRELYRVNWIRARSRKDRWAEEYKYVKAEMGWYTLYMSHFEQRARDWAKLSLGDGHTAYANRQADMWRRRGAEAKSIFGRNLVIRKRDADEGDDPIRLTLPLSLNTQQSNPRSMADPIWTTKALVTARRYDATTFQRVVYYIGSRSRAIATSLAIYSSSPNQEDVRTFAATFRFELISANTLLGIAVCLHGAERIRPSHSLQSLTRLMAHERLEDFNSLRTVIETLGDPDDVMLPFYSGNWWMAFDSLISPTSRELSPAHLLSFFESQQKTLPILRAPIIDALTFNTGVMTRGELSMAWKIAADAVVLLEEDIATSMDKIADLTNSISCQQAMLKDLNHRFQSALAKDADPIDPVSTKNP
ncbi:hypothetical protein NMY22_g7429 [Coprinellus aureogranulatus]|nr:hypothetical protein NMY22_g7429 [Coprinellus aureogranulatus]